MHANIHYTDVTQQMTLHSQIDSGLPPGFAIQSGLPGVTASGGRCSSPYSSARVSLPILTCSAMLLMLLAGASGNGNASGTRVLSPFS